MEFEWDATKHAKTLRERGIGFDDGARIFEGSVVTWTPAASMGKSASGRWAKAKGMFCMWCLLGAAQQCGSSRCGEPIERKSRYGYHANDAR